MRNPVIIELTRGPLLESAHAGAIAVMRPSGEAVASIGNISRAVFPRSAVKALQALPLLESRAADRLGFGEAEIALACASHSGTRLHAEGVRAMLDRAGLSIDALGCGVHEPMDAAAAHDLVRSGVAPSPLEHNCSGKHAGMLATAVHLGEPTRGYWQPEHPVQQRIRRALEDMTGCTLGPDACGVDGCSVPNWAIPLAGLARAFARLATGEGLPPERADACRRIVRACWANPELVAGRGRLDTAVMERLGGAVLIKSGAEGVYCGALPEHSLGFALKIDDGAKRAAEVAAVALIAQFYSAAGNLGPDRRLTNWRGLEVGVVRPTAAFADMLGRLASWQSSGVGSARPPSGRR
jgi:L-asparaginase II